MDQWWGNKADPWWKPKDDPWWETTTNFNHWLMKLNNLLDPLEHHEVMSRVDKMLGGNRAGNEIIEALKKMSHQQRSSLIRDVVADQSWKNKDMGRDSWYVKPSQGFGGAGQMNQNKLDELKNDLLNKFSDLIDGLAKGLGG